MVKIKTGTTNQKDEPTNGNSPSPKPKNLRQTRSRGKNAQKKNEQHDIDSEEIPMASMSLNQGADKAASNKEN